MIKMKTCLCDNSPWMCRMEGSSINDTLKHLMVKDLRIQCRARGITPAGSRDVLIERLREHMIDTGDLWVHCFTSLPLPDA